MKKTAVVGQKIKDIHRTGDDPGAADGRYDQVGDAETDRNDQQRKIADLRQRRADRQCQYQQQKDVGDGKFVIRQHHGIGNHHRTGAVDDAAQEESVKGTADVFAELAGSRQQNPQQRQEDQGFEPPTLWSRTIRTTNCATPRKVMTGHNLCFEMI